VIVVGSLSDLRKICAGINRPVPDNQNPKTSEGGKGPGVGQATPGQRHGMFKGLILWLAGVPLGMIVLLWTFGLLREEMEEEN
jgi:hypothetical protein